MSTELQFFFYVFFCNAIIIPLLLKVWFRVGPKKENYAKKQIPVGAGIVFVLPVFLNFLFISEVEYKIFCLSMFFLACVGFSDDIWGSAEIKGFKGHLKALLRGKLTTGFFKIIGGSIVALITSFYYSTDNFNIVINFLVTVLFINTFNLFDLRPGRCLKIFFLAALLIIFASRYYNNYVIYYLTLTMFVSSLIFFWYDIKAQAMLGDAGSNILGFTIGFTVSALLSVYFKAFLLVILILLHWYTERISLSEVIAKNKVLKYLDNLGR